MKTLTLAGELGRRLEVDVHGRERDAAADRDDASWLRCEIRLAHGTFCGAVEAAIPADDFARFLTELDALLDGSSSVASFTTMEDALAVRIEMDRAGRASVSGSLRELDDSAVLSFAFGSDRTFLAATRADLREIVALFPVSEE